MSTYAYGMRFDDDSNAITVIDEENQTAATTGYINGEPVEFSGGGGSSDFSTAEVLITNNTANDVLCLIPLVTNEGVNALGTLYSNDSGNVTIPLYTGTAILFIDSPVSITGDITEEDGLLHVTGDGTITIS